MRIAALSLLILPLAVLASCVGDDPVVTSGSGDDGGLPEGAAPTKAPTAPTDVKAAADVPLGATVSFKPPIEGAPITRYTVRTTPGGATKDLPANATSAVIDGLTKGQSYTFTVSATNASGTGPESVPTAPVTILDAATAPGKPMACAGNAEAFVYVPVAAGATSYNIYTSTTAGGAKAGATKLSAPAAGRTTVASLTNGTPVYVAVTSLLGTLESAPSPEVMVTPRAFTKISDVLFVASLANNAIDMFDAYSTLANGAGLPSRSLVGASTNLAQPIYGSVHVVKSAGEIYVTSRQTNRLDVFRDAATVTGDVAPARSLSGGNTTLATPAGVVVDTTRNVLYVVNQSDGIRRWDDACNVTGDVAPSATIVPTGTFPGVARQISLDEKNDRLYVPNDANVLVFDNVSTKAGTVSLAPTKTFTMGATATGRYGVSYDAPSDVLFVSSRDELNAAGGNGRVWSFDAASGLPSGAITPTQTVVGPDTVQTMGIQVINNRLYVVRDSATQIARWDDAKNAATTAVSSRTMPQPGVFYTGAAYVP